MDPNRIAIFYFPRKSNLAGVPSTVAVGFKSIITRTDIIFYLTP